jgi:hypothetical protein
MRWPTVIVAIACASGCSEDAVPEFKRVELRRSGWLAEDVTINAAGIVEYHISDPVPPGRSGTFALSREEFRSFLERLEPYRAQAESYSEASAMRLVRGRCPENVPFTYDAGAMYIRWIGPSKDEHFLMEFGCDAGRHAKRNKRMQHVFESLPLPR